MTTKAKEFKEDLKQTTAEKILEECKEALVNVEQKIKENKNKEEER